MRIIETKVYTIDEHPNKEKCYEWIRNNWHDLNQHSVTEMTDSIKALSEKIGGTYGFNIGQFPMRGQYISFEGYSKRKLQRLSSRDCHLTGVTWDIDVIKTLKRGTPSLSMKALHEDSEYLYSNKGLYDLCEANQYEFDEQGNFVS